MKKLIFTLTSLLTLPALAMENAKYTINPQLIKAAKAGDFDQVKSIITTHAKDMEQGRYLAMNAAQLAADRGFYDIAFLLLPHKDLSCQIYGIKREEWDVRDGIIQSWNKLQQQEFKLFNEILHNPLNASKFLKNQLQKIARTAIGFPKDTKREIQQGRAMLSFTNKIGLTPLMQAAQYHRHEIITLLIQNIALLTQKEKNVVKIWLLVDQRLRNENRGLLKDLKKPIADALINSLANDVRERIIKAGGLKALELARQQLKNDDNEKTVHLLEKCLDPQYLTNFVVPQIKLAKKKRIGMKGKLQTLSLLASEEIL